MSAHLCLMAWNDPMGRPNWMRVLAYSTAMSKHRWAPPTCSAARATAARSSVRVSPAPRTALDADEAGRGGGELESGLLAGLVHGGERRAGQPRRATFDGEQAHALGGAGGHQDQVGDMPVDDEHLVAVERPSVTLGEAARVMASRSQRPLSSVIASVAMVSPEAMPGRRSFLADSSPEDNSALAASATVEKYGTHGKRGTHLLEHHDQLDVAEPGAAVLLGDAEGLETELVGHLVPHGPVEALFGLHEPSTSVIGDLSSRNRRTDRLSSSCSSLKAKFIARSPSWAPCRVEK